MDFHVKTASYSCSAELNVKKYCAWQEPELILQGGKEGGVTSYPSEKRVFKKLAK